MSEVKQKEESVDMSLAKLPGKHVWNRRTRKREWVTTMTVILRNLAPTSGFDPQEVWEKEQELEANERKEAEEKEDENAGTGTGTGKKVKKEKKKTISKKDAIIAEQKIAKDAELLNRDMQRITNMKREGATNSLIAIRNQIKSPIAKLELLLEILSSAVTKKERALAFDVFWALEANELYQNAKAELAARKSSSSESSSSSKSSSKKSKEGKEKSGAKEEKLPPKSPEAELLSKHKVVLKTVKEWRAGEDIIVTQLTTMSDRLPPLSPFTSDFRLDPWQKRVLRLIDARKSVVICAPTSSGKTVISTYVATLGKLVSKPNVASAAPTNRPAPVSVMGEDEVEEVDGDEDEVNTNVSNKDRVLFVVPTEPLVWQVAAHFARHILNGNVALVTNQLIYSPHSTLREPPAVVVGTPLALETALTKIRGHASFFEKQHLVDRAQMVGGFNHYGWVVYDEIHVLDGEEGEALQRLIRLMKCNFLALSATVGNAEELRSWMEKVHGEHLNVEVVNAPRPTTSIEVPETKTDSLEIVRETVEESIERAEREDANRLVKLQTHEVRFLNIQRHVWAKRSDSDAYELKLLHPLSAVTVDFLRTSGFKTSSLPMTPRDSYVLFEAMKNHYPVEAIADLDPHRVFSSDLSDRITLRQAKDYEDMLKTRLEQLAFTHETETSSLLNDYKLDDLPPEFDICDMALNLKRQNMLPGLIFHLNVFELIKLFKELLSGVEQKQKQTHPNYYLSLQQKANAKKAQQDSLQRDVKSTKELEEAQREGVIEDSIEVVDFSAPHPDFVFCPGAPISYREFEDICKDVKKRDKFEGDFSKHALMRALRRGIGIYINDHHFTAYRVAIMRLAMQGKLGIVLSDSSLAYGVNMPFRSCVFCGEMGGKLTEILAQQMAGRSGRRGLDTQGHLVYAGARAEFIRKLMLAKIPAIIGREPRYHTQFLQEMLSLHSNPKDLYPRQMEHLGGPTLEDFVRESHSDANYRPLRNFRDVSIRTLLDLNLIEECDKLTPEKETELRDKEAIDFNCPKTISGFRPFQGTENLIPATNCPQLWMIWELRDSLSDSLYLGCMLPHIYDEFVFRNADVGEDVSTQLSFLLFLFLTIDRTPFKGHIEGYCPHDLMTHPFVTRRELTGKLLQYEDRLRTIETKINNLNPEVIPMKESMAQVYIDNSDINNPIKVPLPIGAPLDSTVFECLVDPGHVISRPPEVKQFLKEQFLSISIKLIVMHNTLYGDTAKYGKFEALIRKCYQLIQYVSRDLLQNIVNFPDVSSADTERVG